jgi:hypothetical protein
MNGDIPTTMSHAVMMVHYKTDIDCHDITEILLKVALNTTNPTQTP